MKTPYKRVPLIKISTSNYHHIISKVFSLVGKESNYIVVCAVHLFVEAHKNPKLLDIVNNALFVTPDGMPLVWLLKASGHKNATRVYGPTLMQKMCSHAEKSQKSMYILGGAHGQAEQVQTQLLLTYPSLKIVGYCDAPSKEMVQKNPAKYVRKINQAQPDIVCVGIGCPYQEYWMGFAVSKVKKGTILIGVGAAFDFITHRKKQAPEILQNNGLEWLFRFAQEPWRLFFRYTVVNIYFLLIIAKSFIKDRWK